MESTRGDFDTLAMRLRSVLANCAAVHPEGTGKGEMGSKTLNRSRGSRRSRESAERPRESHGSQRLRVKIASHNQLQPRRVSHKPYRSQCVTRKNSPAEL